MAERLFLEDLVVGQRFVSATREVVAAKGTLFGGLAASGWHTAAMTMPLVVESVPLAWGIIGTGGELTWPRPTRPGDVLHVESEVLEIVPSRSRPERGMVVVRCTTLNQDGETVQVFTPKIVVPRRVVG